MKRSGYDIGQGFKRRELSTVQAWRQVAGWHVARLHWRMQETRLHVQVIVNKYVQVLGRIRRGKPECPEMSIMQKFRQLWGGWRS